MDWLVEELMDAICDALTLCELLLLLEPVCDDDRLALGLRVVLDVVD